MSSASSLVLPATRAHRRVSSRLLRSELRLLFGRRRNQALLVVLALVPVLIGVAIRVSTGEAEPGEGPPFLDRVSGNGLFLAFTGLATVVPFFLPLTIGVVSGDAVAGEAQAGTLRYLLTVPVSRARLLLVKYGGLVAFALAASLLVALVGLLVGWALFPTGDVTLLSGTTIPVASAVGRAGLVALYVTASLAGLAAIGLAVSTFTEVPVAAMRRRSCWRSAARSSGRSRRSSGCTRGCSPTTGSPSATCCATRCRRATSTPGCCCSRLDRGRARDRVEPVHDEGRDELAAHSGSVATASPMRVSSSRGLTPSCSAASGSRYAAR
jgi:ABC-2 type transport system permease protein